ncbi:MAG TPA: hypothetical protein VKQ09_02635 [Sphingomonas sp.]|nr:hypothetical protein [Sphingomonas sp.]
MNGRRKETGVTTRQQDGSTLWVALFTAASALTTAVLACATPFPALAALGAAHLKRSHGVALMLLAWTVSQVVGFGLRHYPHDLKTIGWAAVLGLASIVALFGASWATRSLAPRAIVARLTLGYGTGFVAFKLTVLAGALLLGGAATTLAPALLLHQFVRDGLILVGLELVYRLLRGVGVPAPIMRRVQPA